VSPRPAPGPHTGHRAGLISPDRGGAVPPLDSVLRDVRLQLHAYQRLERQAGAERRSPVERLEHLDQLQRFTRVCVTHHLPPENALIALAAQAISFAAFLRGREDSP